MIKNKDSDIVTLKKILSLKRREDQTFCECHYNRIGTNASLFQLQKKRAWSLGNAISHIGNNYWRFEFDDIEKLYKILLKDQRTNLFWIIVFYSYITFLIAVLVVRMLFLF